MKGLGWSVQIWSEFYSFLGELYGIEAHDLGQYCIRNIVYWQKQTNIAQETRPLLTRIVWFVQKMRFLFLSFGAVFSYGVEKQEANGMKKGFFLITW